jgi:dTDP-glucose 4,6-dehydratase
MESDVIRAEHSFDEIFEADFGRLRGHLSDIDFSNKTLLISGATGFFGAWLLGLCSWIARHQSPAGFHVIAVSRNPKAFIRRHPWIDAAPWLLWIEGDIRSFEIPGTGIDWMIHAATETSAEAGRDAPMMLDSIIGGTRHILECAKQCGAERVLLVSSGAVYGAQAPDISHQAEDTSAAPDPLNASNVYGEAKRVMEMLGAIHADATGSCVVSARCFAFVGAGLPLDGHFAIGNFIRDALDRPQLTIGGDGRGRRSYLYAADLAIWLMRLLAHGTTKRAYNVGSDQDLSIAQLAECVVAAIAPQKPVVIENRLGPSPVGNRYVPSIARARAELDLDVWTALPDAIGATAAWKGAHP